jgi:hypothetical protein
MSVKEFMKEKRSTHKVGSITFQNILPRIKCVDGFELSVQGSAGHYCRPREDGCEYYEVEVGYPSEMVPEFMKYAETPENPTDTVYGWVPIETVEAIVVQHGGIENQSTANVIQEAQNGS